MLLVNRVTVLDFARKNIRKPIIRSKIFEVHVYLCNQFPSRFAFPTLGFAQFSILSSAD